MKINSKIVEESMLRWNGERRLVQDSPVLPEVWRAFGERPEAPLDLLLTPHTQSRPSALAGALKPHGPAGDRHVGTNVFYNDSYVVGRFTFRELICDLLPMTEWFQRYVRPDIEGLDRTPRPSLPELRSYGWLVYMAGLIAVGISCDGSDSQQEIKDPPSDDDRVDAFLDFVNRSEFDRSDNTTILWNVGVNRKATVALWHSRETVKADVAQRAFQCDFTGLRWAVVDTGIDAKHPAFRRRNKDGTLIDAWTHTRVIATYDFSGLRGLANADPTASNLSKDQKEFLANVQRDVQLGRALNWELIDPLLRIPHTDEGYEVPRHEHGTHVAGILAADWRQIDRSNAHAAPDPLSYDLQGICAGLELYDLRVFRNDGPDGPTCDEFTLTSALQFVRFLNRDADIPKVHGVNISISVPAKVDSYACGQTPVCVEANRLVTSGVVTVVAAGNAGYHPNMFALPGEGYQSTTITDPGNAQHVITVGATHRQDPHSYGVSYFSSRGPTGDGRAKPDLVAPGEKITGPVPDVGTKSLDGTSMAAPHVSGAAAVLMARYHELIGKPLEVKRILMDTATDLGREKAFQGAGLVDIFRALQSV